MASDLDFFNSLSGKLEIELSEPAKPIAGLLNQQASPDSNVVGLKLKANIFEEEAGSFRDLTAEELDSVAFRGTQIRLRGESGTDVLHEAPNGEFFTVRELLSAVEDTERKTRDEAEWLGGVDVHHCYFEGIHNAGGGVWEIYWGS